jgi:hypothetical protein
VAGFDVQASPAHGVNPGAGDSCFFDDVDPEAVAVAFVWLLYFDGHLVGCVDHRLMLGGNGGAGGDGGTGVSPPASPSTRGCATRLPTWAEKSAANDPYRRASYQQLSDFSAPRSSIE